MPYSAGLIYRDGAPMETAPNYNVIWVEKIAEYGELLSKTGRPVFDMPLVKRLFDWRLDLMCARQFTPSLGDSGDVWGGNTGPLPEAFKIGQRHFEGGKVQGGLPRVDSHGPDSFSTTEVESRNSIVDLLTPSRQELRKYSLR
jgi:hypothetical protein